MTDYTPHVEEPVDEWHLHTADEGVQDAHGAKANPLILLGSWAAITAVVFVVVGAVAVFFSYTSTRLKEARVESTALSAEHAQYKDESVANLEQTAWIDPEEGQVQIKLDSAIEKVVTEYEGD